MNDQLVRQGAPIELVTESGFDVERAARDFVDKSMSDRTRVNYTIHLKQFFAFHFPKQPAEITTRDVIVWRDALRRTPNKRGKLNEESTVAVKLAAVRSFFAFLTATGLTAKNPADLKLVAPPELPDYPKGRALSIVEVGELLASIERTTIIGARDYAVVMLMLRCFFRVSEVVSLRENDFFVEKEQCYVRVTIKGNKKRVTPIPTDVFAAIEDYWRLDDAHRRIMRKRHRNLFVFQGVQEKKRCAAQNSPLSARQVWVRVGHYGEKSGIGKLAPHDFRRTAITRALDLNESYRRVMNAARLANLRTVQRYDHHRTNLAENSIHNMNYDAEQKSR